jgi:glucosylceramidase
LIDSAINTRAKWHCQPENERRNPEAPGAAAQHLRCAIQVSKLGIRTGGSIMLEQEISAGSRRALQTGFSCVAAAALLVACASNPEPIGAPSGQDRVRVWVTTSDHSKALSQEADAHFGPGERLSTTIDVDSAQRYQQMLGFGAAITDASAWLIQHRLDEPQRQALLQDLFGREPGIGLDFTRLTIGASDFSRQHYSLDDMPAGSTDPDLQQFSIARNLDDVVPVTRAALVVNPQLKIMASPWSAPAWMKTSGSLIKGTLQETQYDAFARYLVKYVDAYASQGVPIFALTLQNEPSFEPENYPGMRLSARARADLIGKHLGPMLERHAPGVRILDWDHNWDLPNEPLAVLADARAARYVAGIAWHCYGGDVSAQSKVREAAPDKEVYMTECSGGDWEPVKSGGLTLQARQLIVGTTRHWARGVLFWNLALDETGGPHAGGCGNCRGVVTIDSRTGMVSRTDDYYALAHASRFVRPGASRIASSVESAELDNVAFLNPDDGSIALVVVNSAVEPRRFTVAAAGRSFDYTLPRKSVATFVWHSASDSR